MCQKYPGPRCANHLSKEVKSTTKRLLEAQAHTDQVEKERDLIRREYRDNSSTDAQKSLRAAEDELAAAKHAEALTRANLRQAQDEYYATPTGIQEGMQKVVDYIATGNHGAAKLIRDRMQLAGLAREEQLKRAKEAAVNGSDGFESESEHGHHSVFTVRNQRELVKASNACKDDPSARIKIELNPDTSLPHRHLVMPAGVKAQVHVLSDTKLWIHDAEDVRIRSGAEVVATGKSFVFVYKPSVETDVVPQITVTNKSKVLSIAGDVKVSAYDDARAEIWAGEASGYNNASVAVANHSPVRAASVTLQDSATAHVKGRVRITAKPTNGVFTYGDNPYYPSGHPWFQGEPFSRYVNDWDKQHLIEQAWREDQEDKEKGLTS